MLQSYWRPDVTKKMWIARGRLDADNGNFEVEIHREHRRKIEQAGYSVSWDVAGEMTGDDVPVRLAEHNGRRRIAAVLKRDTGEWIEVK